MTLSVGCHHTQAVAVDSLRAAGNTSGGEFCGSCPWCGGDDRFRYWPDHPSGKPRFWCRGCGRRGDDVDLMVKLRGMSTRDALAAVGRDRIGARPVIRFGPARPQERPLEPPGDAWRTRAEHWAQRAEEALWAGSGARAREYLNGRGFTDATIRAARLGLVAADTYEPGESWGLPGDKRIWIPRGIAIPWRLAGAIWRLNIRRPARDPKYIGPAGSVGGLYGLDGVRDGQPAVLVEGEFDALAIAQQAGDLVAAVATGSTSGGRHSSLIALLRRASSYLVAYDGDEAGEAAATWWLERLPGSRRLQPEGNDPASMLQAGDDLRQWIAGALHANQHPADPHHKACRQPGQ